MTRIMGFTFEMQSDGSIQSTDAAQNLVKELLAPDVQVAIHDLTFDYLGSYGQSQLYPLSCKITGKVWKDV